MALMLRAQNMLLAGLVPLRIRPMETNDSLPHFGVEITSFSSDSSRPPIKIRMRTRTLRAKEMTSINQVIRILAYWKKILNAILQGWRLWESIAYIRRDRAR